MIRSHRQIAMRNDMLLHRHAEDQAFELFQLATSYITEGDKAAAADRLRWAIEILKPYRSNILADLADLLAKITK